MFRLLGELGTMGADLGKASRNLEGSPMISGLTNKTESTSASTSERDNKQ